MSERTPGHTLATVCLKACSAERDRMTAAEICIDELITIMQRHDAEFDPLFATLREISLRLHATLTRTDKLKARHERLLRIRAALTKAFPLTDEDLDAALLPVERDQLTSNIKR